MVNIRKKQLLLIKLCLFLLLYYKDVFFIYLLIYVLFIFCTYTDSHKKDKADQDASEEEVRFR